MREQNQGSRQVLDALTSLNGVTETVKTGAREMTEGAGSLVKGMQDLKNLSQRVGQEMDRISLDIEKISMTFSDVNELIKTNVNAVSRVNGQFAKFKV